MNLELKANVEPSELRFEYIGSELVSPLRALIRWQTSELKSLEKSLKKARERRSSSMPASGIQQLSSPEDSRLELRIRATAIERDDATLWLQECKRKPEKPYQLTMMQLKSLYRQQLDPRTEQK